MAEASVDKYEVTQSLTTVGSAYVVTRQRGDDVLYSIRGELMSPTPKFHLVRGEEGEKLGELSGNFIKTKYEISKDGKSLASVTFPAVAFKKTLTLVVNGTKFEADGGVFKGVFQCKGTDGVTVLEIAKELSIRDTFVVKSTAALPLEVGLLAAVAIHSRFYEMV